jgi:hypothetical protein
MMTFFKSILSTLISLEQRRWSALLALMLPLMHTGALQAAPTTPLMEVSYDKTADQLSVRAEAASLKAVLGQVALQSGLEVLFDEAADGPLTITIQPGSLEASVKQLLRGRSNIMRYNKDNQGKPLLIGVVVLPAGQTDASRARPLLDPNDEAYRFAARQAASAKGQEVDGYVSTGDRNDERWQARLAEMPVKLREQLAKQTAERQAHEQEREQQRQQRAEERAAEREESEAYRAKMRQKQQQRLDALDPETRSRFEQSGEQAREEIRRQLQGDQP